jgi:MerR family mercuric resistance operon transcriptional regulator
MKDCGNAVGHPQTIGQISKHTGCNIETIRYYERIGLMPTPPRSEGGFRLYSEDHVKRLSFIRRSRQLGFALQDVRGLLKLVDGSDYTCDEVQEMTLSHLKEIRAKIQDLRGMESVLRGMAAQCEGGAVPECPIIEALFKSGE